MLSANYQFMNKLTTIIVLLCLILSCSEQKNRWSVEEPRPIDINFIDISSVYFDSGISSDQLVNKFPDFFEKIPLDVLDSKRKDETSQAFNLQVSKTIPLQQVKDSISYLFGYIKDYDSTFIAPKVYSFTGEMPYTSPIAYFSQTHDLIIGLDWFLGTNEKLYDNMGIPEYLRYNMTFDRFTPMVAESIARQMVPFSINKKNFIESIIYEGKIIALMKKFCPYCDDSLLMGFSQEDLKWLNENEAEVYLYFTENDLFFSDDNKLAERFIFPAPFSKFYLENDSQTPGRVGVWMGWQIVKKYLERKPDISIKEMIVSKNGEEIFKDSGYKPN